MGCKEQALLCTGSMDDTGPEVSASFSSKKSVWVEVYLQVFEYTYNDGDSSDSKHESAVFFSFWRFIKRYVSVYTCASMECPGMYVCACVSICTHVYVSLHFSCTGGELDGSSWSDRGSPLPCMFMRNSMYEESVLAAVDLHARCPAPQVHHLPSRLTVVLGCFVAGYITCTSV